MSKDRITIGFSGDLSFSGYFAGCYNDDELFDSGIRSFLNGNDYNVINFESPVTPCRVTRKRRLVHRSDPEALDFVKRNIPHPILSFANNHMMDFGPIGVVDTIDACKARDIRYVGIGHDISEASYGAIIGKDIKIGLLAVEYKKNYIASERLGGPLHESSEDIIKSKIEKLSRLSDYTVVVYHGGEEFVHTPMPYTRRQLKRYLSWGADVVVAHHPHVVQGYERVGKRKAIFYSLGNFVFDTDYQRVQEDTDKGMLLRLSFTRSGFDYEYICTEIDREKKKVTLGADNGFFVDAGKRYGREWSREAERLLDIKARADKLRDEENAKYTEHHESEKARLEAIEAAAEIRRAMLDVSDAELVEAAVNEILSEAEAAKAGETPVIPEPEEKIRKTDRLYYLVKKLNRSRLVNRKAHRKTTVVKFGRFKRKLFYRK